MRAGCVIVVLLLSRPVLADDIIYKCVDASGNMRFTNIKADALAHGCPAMNLPPISSVPGGRPASTAKPAASSSPSPANFPKVDPKSQKQRDLDRRKILEAELANEEKALATARKELTEQEGIRLGSERNYQRVLDRLEPYKKKVSLHENNVSNLRKELSALR
jgi:hypothetical protein